MADLTDIKSILYTEKSLNLQEKGVVVIQTSSKMTKTALKALLKEYFGINAESINSLKMQGKVKRFRGRLGQRNEYKKFYVKLPEGVSLESIGA